jgi:hypothetical protein
MADPLKKERKPKIKRAGKNQSMDKSIPARLYYGIKGAQ